MYMTLQQAADYLGMPISQVAKYIHEGRIRAVDDGEQFVINMNQFQNYHEQLEQAKKEIDEWRKNFLLPDRDVKDED